MVVLLVGVWVDLGLVSACGVELCLPLVGAWGGAEELGESDRVE